MKALTGSETGQAERELPMHNCYQQHEGYETEQQLIEDHRRVVTAFPVSYDVTRRMAPAMAALHPYGPSFINGCF